MAELQDIVRLTVMLSAAYPNWAVTDYTNEIYYQDLKDIPADVLMLAAQYCRTSLKRDQRFAPSVGEIRAAAGELQRKTMGIPSALEAWNEVCGAPKPYPADYVIYRGGERVEAPVHQWSHPLVEKIAREFGWPDFPKFDNESTERAHFLRQYEMGLQNMQEENMLVPEVRGYIEFHNDAILKLSKGMSK